MDVQKPKKNEKNSKWLIVAIPICFLATLLMTLVLIVAALTIGSRLILGTVQNSSDNLVANAINGKGGKVTSVSEAELREVLLLSELSTAEYSYNAVMRVYEEDGTTEKYYVAYDATVKAGIDFDDIDITIDEDTKTITLKIPKCKIMDETVDFGSMDFIFPDSANESETITQEAYELCQQDLKKRMKQENYFITFARENAIAAVEALIEPWVQEIDDDYTVVIE